MEFSRINDRTYILKQCGKINIYRRQDDGILMYEELNETAYEILELSNGQTSIEDISKKLADKYNEKLSNVQEIVKDFLMSCKYKGYVDINNECKLSKNKIFGHVDMIIPNHMLIETTYRCPLECKHCINESGIHRTESIPSDILINTLKKLSDLGTKEITLTGGEVTTRKDFIDLVKLCSSKFQIVSVLTTGYLIDEEMILEIDRSCKKNIIWQISIDGNEEIHNKIRGNSQAYKKAMNAIKTLKKYSFVVSVSSTIHKYNIDQMEDIYLNIKDSGADRLTYGMIIEKGRADKNNISINDEFLKRLKSIENKYKSENLLVSEDLSKPNLNIKREKCDLGTYILSIKATGDVVICPGFDLSLGNIIEDSLEKILSGMKAKSILNLKAPSNSLCGECPSIHECRGCHSVPFNKKNKLCDWKIKNENILNEFLKIEKAIY
ncbi:PqqD family peptide modification chaperone [Clostridium sporogenes]